MSSVHVPFLPILGFGSCFSTPCPLLGREIEAGGESCRAGREVSIAHVSRECPRAGPLASLRLSDSIHFKHSDPFPLETVRGGSSRSGFSATVKRRKGHRAWAQRAPSFLPVGQRDSGRGGKGLSAGQTLRVGAGAAWDLLPRGLGVKTLHALGENRRPARHFRSEP